MQNASSRVDGFLSLLTQYGVNFERESVRLSQTKRGFYVSSATDLTKQLRQYLSTCEDDGESIIQGTVLYISRTGLNSSSVGFGEFISDPELFLKSMVTWNSPTRTDSNLIKVLLALESIQPELIDILLQKLPELSDTQTAKLLLNQIRWIEFVVKPSELTQNLMLCLQACSTSAIQRDIITILPEVVADNEHEAVTETLLHLMQMESSVTLVVLDTLSLMNLPTPQLTQVTEQVLASLPSAEPSDLPMIVKFLIQHTQDVQQLVTTIRESLDIDSLMVHEEGKRVEGMLMETTVQAFGLRSDFVSTYLNTLLKLVEQYKTLDCWMLFGMYSIPKWKKNALRVLKKMDKSVLVHSIQRHKAALSCVFTHIVDLASHLISSEFYQALMMEFDDTFYRQEIIDAILTHSGSTVPDQVDCALDSLLSTSPQALNPFLPYLNQLLDFVQMFSLSQARKVYQLLSLIVTTGDRSGLDQFQTIINKQLCHLDEKYRRLGLLGSIALLSKQEGSEVDIERTLTELNRTPGCQAFLLDELNHAIQQNLLPTQTTQIASDLFSELLEREFLADYAPSESHTKRIRNIETSFQFNLDGRDAALCLQLVDIVTSSEPQILQSLCPLIRLVSTCESAISGNLDGIDAVLGCPLQLVEQRSIDQMEHLTPEEVNWISLTYDHAINWCRELVNVFCLVADNSIQAKVLERFDTIYDLEQLGVESILEKRLLHPRVLSVLKYPTIYRKTLDSQDNTLHKDVVQLDTCVMKLLFDLLENVVSDTCRQPKRISFFNKNASERKYDGFTPGQFIELDLFDAIRFHVLSVGQKLTAGGSSEDEVLMMRDILTHYLKSLMITAQCTTISTSHVISLVTEQDSISEMIRQVMEFKAFVDSSLPNTVIFIQTLEALIKYRAKTDQSLRSELSDLAKTYLTRDWGKQRFKATDLQYLVQIYLSFSKVPLQTVESLALAGFESLLEHNGSQCVPFPTLTAATVTYYIRPMLQVTVNAIAPIDFTIGVNQPEQLIVHLHHATLIMKLLVGLTKVWQKPAILACVLRTGQKYVETLQKAMPLIQRHFREYSQTISVLLRDMQGITRRMQTLCAHGKEETDKSIATVVPAVKKALEMLVYRVKELVEVNGLGDVYSMGILKNRRIDGTAIKVYDDPEEQKESEEGSDEGGQEEDDDEEEEEEGGESGEETDSDR